MQQSQGWLLRFGADVPSFAHVLLHAAQSVAAQREAMPEVREAAQALGVLRAQQGHSVAGLVEDLLALRQVLAGDDGAAVSVVDAALSLAVAAYVDELTAVLSSRATRDPLTGLPNRAAFEEALLHEIAGSARAAAPALILIDLDRFKLVNDTDGHLAGDAVLVAVADVLRGNLRPSDVACRLGGDEFAIVLARTTAARALTVARRMLTAARKAPGLSSPNARVTFSIGIGWLAAPAEPAQLVALADAALYDVKRAGGDDVRTGEPAS
jgi:diguanylate cyclase (GGDEF)-like protein